MQIAHTEFPLPAHLTLEGCIPHPPKPALMHHDSPKSVLSHPQSSPSIPFQSQGPQHITSLWALPGPKSFSLRLSLSLATLADLKCTGRVFRELRLSCDLSDTLLMVAPGRHVGRISQKESALPSTFLPGDIPPADLLPLMGTWTPWLRGSWLGVPTVKLLPWSSLLRCGPREAVAVGSLAWGMTSMRDGCPLECFCSGAPLCPPRLSFNHLFLSMGIHGELFCALGPRIPSPILFTILMRMSFHLPSPKRWPFPPSYTVHICRSRTL